MNKHGPASSGIISTLTLFSSFGTLICCALPALFVTLGAGAAVVGLVGAVPQLVWLSERKVPLFIFAGTMLLLSAVMRYRSRNAPCPADPAKAKACARMRRFGGWTFFFSLAIYLAGFYFAFLAQYLL